MTTTHHRIPFLLSLLTAAVILLITSLTSCDKHNINGDLDGFWQIMEVERTLADGSVTTTHPDQKYMGIQLHVCQLRAFASSGPSANLTYSGSTLTLDFPEALYGDEPEKLHAWGIYSLRTVYDVVTLTKSTLVLKSADTRLTCRKF